MRAQRIQYANQQLTLQVTIDLSGRSLMTMEEQIQNAVNEVGCLATEDALKHFDTDGSPISIGGVKWTQRECTRGRYQTPYGVVFVKRHIYQTANGGKTYCPLDQQARLIRNATPRFAKQLTHKYAEMNVNRVCNDLRDNHGRDVAVSYVQNVADWVGGIACAKEEHWEYETPTFDSAVSTVVVSLDGAHLLIKDRGYKQAMVGTLSLYNFAKERLHTIYIGEAPESGKSTFTERLTREIERVKALYPNALYLGIADGAADNWTFLEQHTDRQLLDYYHASDYLPHLAQAAYPGKTDKQQREKWLQDHRHALKHTPQFVEQLLKTAQRLNNKTRLSNTVKEQLQKALTYFTNQQHRMDYAGFRAQNLPIGSGVTEAACKVLVKQRLCGSGMRWKTQGARIVLSLRALSYSTGRWTQFWQKIDQFGAVAC